MKNKEKIFNIAFLECLNTREELYFFKDLVSKFEISFIKNNTPILYTNKSGEYQFYDNEMFYFDADIFEDFKIKLNNLINNRHLLKDYFKDINKSAIEFLKPNKETTVL